MLFLKLGRQELSYKYLSTERIGYLRVFYHFDAFVTKNLITNKDNHFS